MFEPTPDPTRRALRSLRSLALCALAHGSLAILFAPACSSGSSTSISIAEACSELATARCNLRSLCTLPEAATGVGFNVLEVYGDVATCLQREKTACTNGLSAPHTGNSPALVQKCVADFATYSCADFFDNLPPMDCTPTGSLADGAGCAFNAQCQSGFCNGTKDSACGICGTPPAVGDDCSASNCARGDRCLGATSLCAAVVSSNGTCNQAQPCDRGLSCVGENAKTGTAGTCEAAGTRVGVACGGTMPGCDPTRGLYCSGPSGSKVCAQAGYAGTTAGPDGGVTANQDGGAPGPTPEGTPCGQLADGTRAGCVAGGCYTATGPASGSDLGACKPFAPDDGACDTLLGPACMAPARCVTTAGATSGTCIVPTAAMCPGA